MTFWLNKKLKQEIKRVFEPRYCRKLTDNEIVDIAENLTGYMESIFKWRWKELYADK